MHRHARQMHWITLLILLVGLSGPGLTDAQADDGPPPSADDAPSAPTAIAPTACVLGASNQGNMTPQAIHDFSTITSSVTVSTSLSYVWNVRVVTKLTHTANGNLDLTLVSPSGTRVLLAANQGGSNDNVFADTSWQDDADNPVTDFAFTNNVTATKLSPQEPLGALRGEDGNGLWQLVIHDGVSGDEGQLQKWTLFMTGLNHAPDVVTTTDISSTGSVPIPNFGLNAVPIIVPSLPDPITALTVSTVLTHPRPGSLVVFLAAPSNFTVTLSSLNGLTATNAFAGTVWDDRAARSDPLALVTTHHYATGQLASPLAPEEPLSAVLNKNATGVWQLKVVDVFSDSLSGAIGPVVLHVQTGHCNPNLSVEESTRPILFPRISETATLTIRALNTSLTATNISLTANLAPPIRFQSIETGSWSCSAPAPNSAGGTIHCTRPSLGANQDDSITATVTAPPVPGQTPMTLTVSSSLPDTDPSDNTDFRNFVAYAQSANGSPLDVLPDTGAMNEGGQDAFDIWGGLRVAVYAGSSRLTDTSQLDFGLAFGGPGQRWNTTTPVSLGGVQIARQLLAPVDQNWVRYVDTFHNTSGAARSLLVGWGGNLGSDTDTYVQASSSGDPLIAADDTWAVTQQYPPGTAATDSPVGYALRSPGDHSYLGPVIFDGTPITTTWPISGEEDVLSHLFSFSLAPGQTRRLAYFVYRGLAEDEPGPYDCDFYGKCVTPLVGAEVALADSAMAALVTQPALCDLSFAERASLVNWPEPVPGCGDKFLFVPVLMR